MVDRLLSLTSGDGPDRTRAEVRAFCQLALLYGAARSWLWVALGQGREPAGTHAAAAVLTVCLALSFVPRASHLAPRCRRFESSSWPSSR